MLNLGMTEIFCFAVIALLILGPEKLPEAVRFVAKWYGKIKRLISNLQNELDRELRLSEFREEIQKEIEKIGELERKMQQQLDELKTLQANAEPKATAASNSVLYRSCVQPYYVPFSLQYQQHFIHQACPKRFDTDLKIAV